MRNLIRYAAGTVAGVVLATGGAQAAPQGQDRPDPVNGRDLPSWTVKPCKSEDSVNCRWNARTQGNGHRHTFIVREVPGSAHMVCVFYVVKRYARTHDYCA